MKALGVLALSFFAALSGCASHQTKYDWGQYDPSLYSYYKDPTKLADYAASLDAIIKSADSTHTIVPPGIYAEFGYLQLQAGKSPEAVELFRMEESHWPESKVFMEHMITVAASPTAGATADREKP